MDIKCKKSITVVSLLLLLSACASKPEDDPAYISPTFYQGYNCKQLKLEQKRVSQKIDVAIQTDGTTQVLNAAVTAFAISQGYGVSSGQGNVELRRLKNQMDVLDQTLIQKECL